MTVVATLIDAYLDHLRVERRLAAHTLESYARDLRALAAYAAGAGRAVEALDRQALEAFVRAADGARAVAALGGADGRRGPRLLPLPRARPAARAAARPTICSRRAPGRRCRSSCRSRRSTR